MVKIKFKFFTKVRKRAQKGLKKPIRIARTETSSKDNSAQDLIAVI
ncbi:hypothetical protein NIES2104_61530 [Leptolyngbya sp. NIES-2104]|nr:hypothetical protein NIES2104_61530 [Leptolyngbya sp. NIES-2104]